MNKKEKERRKEKKEKNEWMREKEIEERGEGGKRKRKQANISCVNNLLLLNKKSNLCRFSIFLYTVRFISIIYFSLSLSLYIYIYIYIYVCVCVCVCACVCVHIISTPLNNFMKLFLLNHRYQDLIISRGILYNQNLLLTSTVLELYY